jgi:alpha-beta hydrolase superfamily lysophospholipase
MDRRNFVGLATMTSVGAATGLAQAASISEKNSTVTIRGVEIPCRISRPSRSARGAVLLLPGSLFSDVDGNYPSKNLRPHVYADLARQLSALGLIVLRMAKIGPGTGARVVDPTAAADISNFETRVEAAEAALHQLQSIEPGGPTVVAGHSEGALVAFLLAAGPEGRRIDGVVSLSGPSLSIFGVMREQIVAMAPLGAETPDLSAYDGAIADLRAGRPLSRTLANNPQTAMLAAMPPQSIAYLVSVDRIDPLRAVAQVRQPMLIVQGGRDASVPASNAARLIKARGHLPTQKAFFPELTHFYKRAAEGLSPMHSMSLETQSDPAVARAIVEWVMTFGV